MAQQTVSPKMDELGPGNGEPGLSSQEKRLPVPVKKTPLRDLQSENNIVAQKGSGNPLVLKEAVTTEAGKASGTKRPSPESSMSPSRQHSPSSNGANGHLVYVRRKSEAEAAKNCNHEVVADNTDSPQPKLLGPQEEDVSKQNSFAKETQMLRHAYVPLSTTSVMSIPAGKPSLPVSPGNSDHKTFSEEPCTQPVPSTITPSVQPSVNKQDWEERYLQLQMFLKTVDQSSLEDHLQMLRSLSAVELSRHAVELEKRAIQLALEQGKELQRVKSLNVLGKAVKTSNGPPAEN